VIYVRRDSKLIPKKLIRAAEKAQKALEKLPASKRPGYIKKKAAIWRAFAGYLSQMSYGKCWYSESPDPQSFFDVDHFRPKLRARRSDQDVDPGYEWLAFSWENFRYSSQRSNRLSTNEEDEEVSGKGDWFPLLNGSQRATWDNRCEAQEQPALLDPTVPADVRLIDVEDDGQVCQSRFCMGDGPERVSHSVRIYGLNLPKLVEARRRVIRQVNEAFETLNELNVEAKSTPSVGKIRAVVRQQDVVKRLTLPDSPYARAARAHLYRLGVPELAAQPEEFP
jgi:hypothetical protein